MLNRTSEVRAEGQRHTWIAGLAFALLHLPLSACGDDIGDCCTVLREEFRDRIPTATTSQGGVPDSRIALDPVFDCESLICVAYRGSPAFCTARCGSDGDCPQNFVCENVLMADPGPGANIRPQDKFCVRDQFICSDSE